ncbi:MAG: nucleotidyl transferase AbiEii/AbiGii toxin family protein [Firmicutes bacterium]|nr:nucleotidyl transferase AbiEii/AbiGii toxin family protein [Candidatus Fermentithermobacillaceae bacterium]
MFSEVIPEPIRLLLPGIASVVSSEGFYLAGGTAAALQLGHRQSVDLDFFSPQPFNPDKLVDRLSELGDVHVVSAARDTLNVHISGVRVSFFQYAYPLIAPVANYQGLTLASLRDISLMKIVAVSNRGSRKDFVDLYAICTRVWSLKEALDSLPRKFGKRYSLAHILRSLTYFEDAEREPELQLLDPAISWPEVKKFFREEVLAYMRASKAGEKDFGL